MEKTRKQGGRGQRAGSRWRVAIGADHAGLQLKMHLVGSLKGWGYDVCDVGTYDQCPTDYPDIAERVGSAVLGDQQSRTRGILCCGSGVGVSIAANKLPGIRAGLCHDLYSAQQGVEHDGMNVLALGARVIDLALASQLVCTFLRAHFLGKKRHLRRLEKVRALEERNREVSLRLAAISAEE